MDKNMKKLVLAICSVFLAASMLGALTMAEEVDEVNEINLRIDPYMINLNANTIGNHPREVIVTLDQYFGGGLIENLDVDMTINGEVATEAGSAHVSYFTGLANVKFNFADIQQYAIDNNLSGVTDVTVAGSFTVNGHYYAFTGDSQVYFK